QRAYAATASRSFPIRRELLMRRNRKSSSPASSKGQLYIYDGATFAFIKNIDFHGDVDSLRYDAANQREYVGYGEDETGAIGVVDGSTSERLPEEYKLGAHPESFQLETSGPNI